MIKFISKIFFFFLLLFLVDRVVGGFIAYAVNHISVGGQARDNYICNESKDSILIFGSSRAVHHYNATMIGDSLGVSCYNCGEDGNGIILDYARLKMNLKRRKPKIIILDVNPEYDINITDNHKYLGWLKAHYDDEGIREIFYDIDYMEKYKMNSWLYRYNSKFLQNLIVFATGKASSTGVNGFRPLNEKFDPMKIRENAYSDVSVDMFKLRYIDRFIDACGDAKVYFVVSPMWYGLDSATISPVVEICKKRKIPFIDYSNNNKFVRNNELFKDGNHLNAQGADIFTNDLIQLIR